MTEKRQTSQGYIIRILQHYTTKLWNIANFVMLFQAVTLAVMLPFYVRLKLYSIIIYMSFTVNQLLLQ